MASFNVITGQMMKMSQRRKPSPLYALYILHCTTHACTHSSSLYAFPQLLFKNLKKNFKNFSGHGFVIMKY